MRVGESGVSYSYQLLLPTLPDINHLVPSYLPPCLIIHLRMNCIDHNLRKYERIKIKDNSSDCGYNFELIRVDYHKEISFLIMIDHYSRCPEKS